VICNNTIGDDQSRFTISHTRFAAAESAGFTLIELLVSLTILAMVSAAVVSGLRTGVMVWEKGSAHLDDLRRSRLVIQLLRAAVGGAMPFTYRIQNGDNAIQKLAFEANNSRLQFVSRNSFRDGPNSLPRWIDIRWVRDAGKAVGDLIVEERTILPPENGPGNRLWSSTILQSESCAFSFLENSDSFTSTWAEQWQPSREQLPKAVRLYCVGATEETTVVIPLDYAASYLAGLRLN
jgi:prepilin-type N-terminal cleavage/methylation domain-containing protein